MATLAPDLSRYSRVAVWLHRIPLPGSRTEDAHELWEKVHVTLAYTALALLALHAAGALKHHLDGRRHLSGGMAPWARRGEPRP